MKKLLYAVLGVALVTVLVASAHALPFGQSEHIPPGLLKKIETPPPGLTKKDPYVDVIAAGKSEKSKFGGFLRLANSNKKGDIIIHNKVESDNKDLGYKISFSSIADTDPWITYTFMAYNYSGAAMDFNFVETIPLDPIVDGPYNVSARLEGTLTDQGGGGASVAPIGTETTLQRAFIGDANDNWMSLGADVGNEFSADPENKFYPFLFEAGEQAGPTDVWSQLAVELDFTLSPGDIVSGQGRVDILPTQVAHTPIPSTVILFGSGLIGLLGLRRKTEKS